MQNNKILTDIINKVAKQNNISPHIVEAVLLSIFKTVKVSMHNLKCVKIPYIAKFMTSDNRIAWINSMKNNSKLIENIDGK